MLRTPRELRLSQCCYFLQTQPFILKLLRGLFATIRRFGLEFLFSPVTPFLASCSAHANMHTCRTRTPLSMGASVQQQVKHSSPSSTSVSEGQQVNCKDGLGVKTQGLLLLLLCACGNFWLFHKEIRWGLPFTPCTPM